MSNDKGNIFIIHCAEWVMYGGQYQQYVWGKCMQVPLETRRESDPLGAGGTGSVEPSDVMPRVTRIPEEQCMLTIAELPLRPHVHIL